MELVLHFKRLKANHLNIRQISDFTYSWYDAIEKNQANSKLSNKSDEQKYREQRARLKAEQLVKTIDDVESIRNLAKTPLLLSMICFVHYNKTLPQERISLYEDCSRLLLEQWDVEKGMPQDDIPLSFSRKEILTEEIAYVIHSGYFQNGKGAKEISGKEIIETIGKTLEKFGI